MNLGKENFTGDRKNLHHFLLSYEKKVIAALLPRVPACISTAHLTLMTVLWSLGIVAAGFLAAEDIRWLWVTNVCIFMQHITDMLDGAVGRARNSGLIKWGFYMDHLLDYFFLSAIVIGYSFLLPPWQDTLVLACLMTTAGFMVHTLMDFSITNDFKISVGAFGVSEVRVVLILFNFVLMFMGKALLANIFPWVVPVMFAALCVLVYKSQKLYRRMDINRQAIENRDEHTELIVDITGH